VETSADPFHRVIMAFNTDILSDAENEIENSENNVKYISQI